MKSLVKTAQKVLEIREEPTPKPNGYDAIVRVTHCGICGTDVHIWEGEDRVGLVMGHEFSGVIEEPGQSDFKPGDRVMVQPYSPYSAYGMLGLRDIAGGFATHLVQDPKYLIKLPDAVGNEAGALIEPMTVGYNAVLRTHIQVNDKVLIMGTGIIGLASAEYARLAGAETIVLVGVKEEKNKKLAAMGIADHVLGAKDPDIKEKLMAITGGVGFDRVIECVGVRSAVQLCFEVAKPEGHVSWVGMAYDAMPIAIYPILKNQLTLQGVYGGVMEYSNEVIRDISKGRVRTDHLITSRIALDQVQQKMTDMIEGRAQDIKVMIVNE